MIAVTAIVKNEEKLLGRMLKSCKGLPVFIIDTGSSDKTYNLYKKHNVKWAKYSKWNDCQGTADDFSFSEARNEALDLASEYEWRVIIDADEYLEKGFIDGLKKVLQRKDIDNFDVVAVQVRTNSETLQSPRVLRNIPQLRYEDIVHNRLPYSEENRDKAIVSDLNIRSGYSPNHTKDPGRTERLLRAALKKEPNKARFYYYLAREYMTRYGDKKIIEMVNLLEHYCYMALSTNEKADAHLILAIAYHKMGNSHQARQHAWESLKIIPTLDEAWKLIHELSHPRFKPFFINVINHADNDGALTVRTMAKKSIQ